ncbi:MAG: hypothetical protein RLZZ46_283 [Bacteroidota bacterium]|jgi:hypothetical protein
MNEDLDNRDRGAVYGKQVKAGKRTYFFDVKATRGGDHYLTITESKKRFTEDGKFVFDKHKLFIYREDFDKFADAFREAVDFIREQPVPPHLVNHQENGGGYGHHSRGESDVQFEDLGS